LKKIFTILLVVVLASMLKVEAVLAEDGQQVPCPCGENSGQSVNQAGAQPCPCGENSEGVLNLPEEADANKAVALALASDDFHSLSKSIREDGLHFDAGHHQTFLVSEYESYRTYIVYFGFEPSVTGSRVGIIALVDVSTEILLIARVDQSSPDPQGLRTVTVQNVAGDTKEFTITWDIEPHNFDWDCFLSCTLVPPPAECLTLIPCCVGFPPSCIALAACMGVQAVFCAISYG